MWQSNNELSTIANSTFDEISRTCSWQKIWLNRQLFVDRWERVVN